MTPLRSHNVSRSKHSAASEQQWLADLADLLLNAKARFGDVSWVGDDSKIVHAHKAIVYARAAGSFQQKYLVPTSTNGANDSSLSLPFSSNRSGTSHSADRSHDVHSRFLRSPSPVSINSTWTVATPMPLVGTDPALFEACLEFLYTGSKGVEVFTVLFDGFDEAMREDEKQACGVERLRQDLLYCWRSKLYSDVSLCLGDNSDTTFASHRALLASRSPYFKSILLGNYADSSQYIFTLPSPPFTPASTTFTLGYIYCGTLAFSDRTFDLTTAMEIFRCADYLGLTLLRDEVEDRIEDVLNVKRAARIFSFASASDVNSLRLRRAASVFVLGNFGDVWGCPQIGNLEFAMQKQLVADVCATINPVSLTAVAKSAFVLRKRIKLEKAPWAEHVRSMVEAIEDRLRDMLGKSLKEIVVSPSFVDLIDGVGFSTDVLEWLLELVVGGLTEAKAPEAYEALVGSVLLREEGILMDAKVLVEDAKNGILKYLKRKWVSVRASRGFDQLESWCVKELSDELEVSVDDLLAATPKSTSSTWSGPPRPTPRTNVVVAAASIPVRRPPTAPILSSTRLSAAVSRPAPAIVTAPATRTSRVSTSSIVSRLRTASVASRITTTNAGPSATAVRGTAGSRGERGGAARGAATSREGRGIGSTAGGISSPAITPTAEGSGATKDVDSRGEVTTLPASPPRPSQTPPLPPMKAFPTLSTTAPTPPVKTPLPESSNAAARRPSASGTPVVNTRPATSSTSKTPASPAPSITSQRKPTTSSAKPSGARTPTQSRAPSLPPIPTTLRASTSVPSTSRSGPSTTASVKGKEKATVTPVVATLASRRPTSVASTTSTEPLRRPKSSASIKSDSAIRAPPIPSIAPPARARPPSITSVKSTSSKAGARASPHTPAVKPPVAKKKPFTTSTKLNGANGAAALPSPKASSTLASRPPPLPTSPGLPGTTLLSGIPCIVTVSSDKPMRFKASVRYLGRVLWDKGQWVGVEAVESAIPAEARALAWNDGAVDGMVYFLLTPGGSPKLGSGRGMPASGDVSDNAASSSMASSASLLLPSRRARRSSSTDTGSEAGPRRGLFVRPNQIVYVL